MSPAMIAAIGRTIADIEASVDDVEAGLEWIMMPGYAEFSDAAMLRLRSLLNGRS